MKAVPMHSRWISLAVLFDVWSVLSVGVLSELCLCAECWCIDVVLLVTGHYHVDVAGARSVSASFLHSFSFGSFIAVVLDGHEQCRWSFTAKAENIKGRKTAHISVTLLFCRFKILWLTLCQLHNEFEIEVSLSSLTCFVWSSEERMRDVCLFD